MNKHMWQVLKINYSYCIYTGDRTLVSGFDFPEWGQAQAICDEHNSALISALLEKGNG